MAKKQEKQAAAPIEEKIIERPLGRAIHDYMMPYAEYIILERALPRVEDGLKPVQRRILYSMHELNLKPDGPFKKSARVVGDCLGKYHPHGDSSIYGAMVNMAQDFNMRNRLVHGHGNFGSIDGDGAAAMRYTEVKLDYIACELLRDLEKNTVKWVKNFDDSLDEPEVLPGRFPNLLVNGAEGIAIGLSTKIPQHNLTEIIDAAVAMLRDPKITIEELLGIVKGPDFPTGGYIIADKATLKEMYETGAGKFVMRAKADIQPAENGKQNIVITELPYNVNKATLQQDIIILKEEALESRKDAKMVELLGGIQEINDESDRNGISVVIRLRKDADAVALLNLLYKKTALQCNFSANMVAIAEGRPQQLGLIAILRHYLAYQRKIIYRRSSFDLENALKREHILIGFTIILKDIDGVVAVIKSSSSRSDASAKLRAKYDISERQADAVLDLRLGQLTKLEITKIENELRELEKLIFKLNKIVSNPKEQDAVVIEELLEIRDNYKSKRLSVIVSSFDDVQHKSAEKGGTSGRRGYAVITADAKVKFISPLTFHSFKGIPTAIAEIAKEITVAEKGTRTLVFSNLGLAYKLDTAEIVDSSMSSAGQKLCDLFPTVADKKEKAVSVLNIADASANGEVLFFTKKGFVKRLPLKELNPNKDVFSVCALKEEGDEIINVELRKDSTCTTMISTDGMCINVNTEDFPVYKRDASGIIGMVLNEKENVFWAGQCELDGTEAVGEIAVICSKGYAKRVFCAEIEVGGRARKGVKIVDTAEAGDILFARPVTNTYNIALVYKDKSVKVVETEEILIDRNRLGKGKPFKVALDVTMAVRL